MKKTIFGFLIILASTFNIHGEAKNDEFTNPNYLNSKAKAAAASSYNTAMISMSFFGIAFAVGIGTLCILLNKGQSSSSH